MEARAYTVIDYKEISTLISDYFGWGTTEDPYNIVCDMSDEDSRWQNDSDHAFTVDPDIHGNNEDDLGELAEIAEDGQIKYSYRLSIVLRLLMMRGSIPWGNVLIQVCW